MRIVVVGAGMYVTGREGTGTGTVLSSLAEYSKHAPLEEVVVVARNAENGRHVDEAMRRINGLLGTRLQVRYERLPADGGLRAPADQDRQGHAGGVRQP